MYVLCVKIAGITNWWDMDVFIFGPFHCAFCHECMSAYRNTMAAYGSATSHDNGKSNIKALNSLNTDDLHSFIPSFSW